MQMVFPQQWYSCFEMMVEIVAFLLFYLSVWLVLRRFSLREDKNHDWKDQDLWPFWMRVLPPQTVQMSKGDSFSIDMQ